MSGIRNVQEGLADYVTWATDTAWCAGLFEGEGSFGQKSNRYKTPTMQMSMTDEDVLRRFHRLVEVGHCYGPQTDPRRPHFKPFWRWAVGGRDVVGALYERLVPHLGERRAERGAEVLRVFDELRAVRLAMPRLPRTCRHGHRVKTAADEYVYPCGQRKCLKCLRSTQAKARVSA